MAREGGTGKDVNGESSFTIIIRWRLITCYLMY